MSKVQSFTSRLRALVSPPSSSATGPDAAETKAWPTDEPDFEPPPDSAADLIELDHSYAGMYRLHRTCHDGLIAEIGANIRDSGAKRFLEVAPGTGWIARSFIDVVPEYWALELSEAALKLLLRRFPTARAINCSIEEADVVANGAFDVVFCASMLEHIGDHETALRQMIRIAGSDLYVLFYEGLGADGEARSQQLPFDKPEWRNWYGVKFTQYQDKHGGFFMKRYARSAIDAIVRSEGAEPIYLDGSNRPYLSNETILHVRKRR